MVPLLLLLLPAADEAPVRLLTGLWYTVWWIEDDAQPEVYLFDGGCFVYQSALPRRATAIVAPAGMLERIRGRYRQ